jgi:hypothetical protein
MDGWVPVKWLWAHDASVPQQRRSVGLSVAPSPLHAQRRIQMLLQARSEPSALRACGHRRRAAARHPDGGSRVRSAVTTPRAAPRLLHGGHHHQIWADVAVLGSAHSRYC